jgi:hypothetical protein
VRALSLKKLLARILDRNPGLKSKRVAATYVRFWRDIKPRSDEPWKNIWHIILGNYLIVHYMGGRTGDIVVSRTLEITGQTTRELVVWLRDTLRELGIYL